MVRDRRKRSQSEEGTEPLDRLTEREIAVLHLITEGLSNKDIARALLITTHGVKAHVSRILHKLGVESRTEAAVLCTRAGLTSAELHRRTEQ